MRRPVRRDRRGIAAAEFAILLPAVTLLFIGTAEAVAYLRTWHRLEQAAASAAEAGARTQALNTVAVEGVFQAARAVAAPFAAWNVLAGVARARTVVSAVTNTGGGNVVAWTCSRGDSTLSPRVAGGAALPGALAVPRGQTVLVVEVINRTPPWVVAAAPGLMGTAGAPTLHAHAVVRPRVTELDSVAGGCPA